MVIDLSFLNLNTDLVMLVLKILAGVLILLLVIGAFKIFISWFWLPSRKKKYLDGIGFIMLAIDIPKNNEQSPKAVEHIFSTLSGTLTGANLYEKYWLGKFQLSVSMEIVSLEGYVQFLIRLPENYRDVVEAAFYAQYPEAEIVEVEDYTAFIPDNYPNETHNLWGSDFKLGEADCYPLKTYPKFEHSLSQEFKDPMASLLEVMARIGPGENIWLQWIITPINDKWKKKSEDEVKKIIGEKLEAKKDIGYYITYPFLSFMKFLGDTLVVQAEGSADVKSEVKNDAPNKLLYLTAGQKDVVSGIEEKMSKTGFFVKCRLIYVARKELFNKSKGVIPVIGAINQFNTLNMNYLTKVKTTVTNVDYVRVEKRLAKRQTRIFKAYKNRQADKIFGAKPFILNIEELATLYHFPDLNIKTPMLKITESKRSEPPSRLPTDIQMDLVDVPDVEIKESEFVDQTVVAETNNFDDNKLQSDIQKSLQQDQVIQVHDKPAVQVVLPKEPVTEKKDTPPDNLPF